MLIRSTIACFSRNLNEFDAWLALRLTADTNLYSLSVALFYQETLVLHHFGTGCERIVKYLRVITIADFDHVGKGDSNCLGS